ncbi:sulfatase [Oceaniferula spumae]|uniref:Sulfatase n=1 Tax=Oceaniferula spumae TaxID=2979115 RepID=A0AAT9FRX1_9BACT
MKRTILSLAAIVLPLTASAAKPLNIVFIIADDLGWRDLSSYGSTFYETPHLDSLAKSGTKFTDAYAACPVCSPTRSAVLTGQYPARTRNTDYFGAPNEYFDKLPEPGSHIDKKKYGRFWNSPVFPAPYLGKLADSHTTLPEALKAKGYATFFAGKWHLGPKGSWPTDHGFDINKGGNSRGGPYGGKKYFSPYGNPSLENGPKGEHLPDRLAEETSKFIAANKDKPFLAYLSFYSVHTPLIARKDLEGKYKQKAAKLGLKAKFGPEPPRQNRLVQEHAVYAAMVEAMDLAVGKVLKALEDNGVADNTLVIFTSDNGGLSTSEGSPTSNLPLRAGKGWLYEGGIREPLIVRWPGVTKPGTTSAYQVTSTDFFPTILEAAGLDLLPEQHIDGKSFTTALKDPSKASDHALFWHYPHWGNQGGTPGGAIRHGEWKMIRYYVPGRETQLFNLADDPGEQTNLADKHPEKLKELGEKMDALLKDTDALMPKINDKKK